MPRLQDLSCAACGNQMWRGSTSAPQGVATCRSCRAAGLGPPRARPPWKHGTRTGYRTYGCRCDECREWKNAEARSLRAKRRAGGRTYKPRARWSGKVQTCEQCGEEFRREARGRFCSPACNGIAQRKVYSTELVHVGPAIPKDAPPTPVTVVTLPKWWGVITQGPCAWCGESFTSMSGATRYCSIRCARYAGRQRRGKRFIVSPRFRREIYERDDWTCQLCMEPIDREAHYLDDWAPSLDHIIPQSHALIPDHSVENLRTAHRWCNAIRGDDTWHTDFFEGVA